MLIITPQHPDFYPTLSAAAKIWKEMMKDKNEPGFLVQDGYGVFSHKDFRELQDFVFGGELEETMEEWNQIETEFGIDYEQDFALEEGYEMVPFGY